MAPINERFFDEIGYSKETIISFGFKSFDEESGQWYVSYNNARYFCLILGVSVELANVV